MLSSREPVSASLGAEVEIRSDRGSVKFSAAIQKDGSISDDYTFIEVDVPFDHEAFAVLSGKGARLLGPSGQNWLLAAGPNSLAPVVEKFLAACRAFG